MARRRSAAPRFSLFSFQDIITCTTGIMLMITLVMALRLVQTSAASAPVQTRKLVEQLDAELANIAEQTEVLADQFEQQQDVLNSGALVDAATLQSQQNDLDNRQQQARSDVAQLSEQHQQISSRQQKLAAEVQARSRRLATCSSGWQTLRAA
jgi:chromosome segregation ATPase